MRYDIRDLLGHWVKPREREGEMCPHRCCRGRRPHPDHFPIIMARADLHRASERELLAHLEKWDYRERVTKQILGEIDRREKAGRTNTRRRKLREGRHAEFRAHLENEWVQAERQTKGNMLNRAGERAGIDPRSLFTGPESRVRKYASEELRRYFENHRRVSSAEFQSERAQVRGARGRRESRLYGVY